ncbi:MAG: hypothetical protein EKK62_12185 [Acidimicrobiia bacterium]|nr:MAG: hypothetical protein EKK62_12185 [Acidimicrobiia bacterium]
MGGTTGHTATGSTDRRTTTDTASATGLTEPVTIPALAAIAAGRRPVDGGAHRGSTTDTTNTTIAGVSRIDIATARTAVATGTALSSGAIPETACTTGTTAGAIATGATASAVAALTDIADADIGDATAAASSTGPANAPVDAAVAAITPIATGGGLTD